MAAQPMVAWVRYDWGMFKNQSSDGRRLDGAKSGGVRFGLYCVAAVSPRVHVGDPAANVREIIAMIGGERVESAGIGDATIGSSDLIVTPELSLTGYTCGDLFGSSAVLDAAEDALSKLIAESAGDHRVIVVGIPLRVGVSLMNVAVTFSNGAAIAAIPKSYLPNYREFYEARHFKPAGPSDPKWVSIAGVEIPFGTDVLIRHGRGHDAAMIGIEICEDFWTPVPPSSNAAMAGANVLVNLSASNETIGKADWRRDLVLSQSGRCIAGYVYASAGHGESTSDLVFGGHCLIAENGSMLNHRRAIGDGHPLDLDGVVVVADLDLQRCGHDRRVVGSFDDAASTMHRNYRIVTVDWAEPSNHRRPARRIDATPFVPKSTTELDARCAEIFDLQTAGLVKRLSMLPPSLELTIGVSGGLDSTLALLVALRACDAINKPRGDILGLTMPGFGTTDHTKTSADRLMASTGITAKTMDIRALCLDTFRAMNHAPLGINIDDQTTVDSLQRDLIATPDGASDLTFENVQARQRTLLLMSHGFVLGTGDMSEMALGWCTYNADHMSMYNVNASIPKTLVRFLVRHAADRYFEGEATAVLHRIADTPISPELLPPSSEGEIRQNTEASIGAYELHDFFLYHFVRNGFDREKILFLASHCEFETTDDLDRIAETYDTFERRFYQNQFKRNCVPDGPKVGSVSLSPRGDWRMPSDANRPSDLSD